MCPFATPTRLRPQRLQRALPRLAHAALGAAVTAPLLLHAHDSFATPELVMTHTGGEAVEFDDDPMAALPPPAVDVEATWSSLSLDLRSSLLRASSGRRGHTQWANLAFARLENRHASYPAAPFSWGGLDEFELGMGVGARGAWPAGAIAGRFEYGGILTTDAKGSGLRATFELRGDVLSGVAEPEKDTSSWSPYRERAFGSLLAGCDLELGGVRVEAAAFPALGGLLVGDEHTAGPLWLGFRMRIRGGKTFMQLDHAAAMNGGRSTDMRASLCSGTRHPPLLLCSFAQVSNSDERLSEVGLSIGIGLFNEEQTESARGQQWLPRFR